MRAVAGQREALGGDLAGMMEAELVAAARPGKLERPEEAAHSLLYLCGKGAIGKAEDCRRILRLDRPDNRRTSAGQHRQDGERSGRVKDLIGYIAVRARVRDGGDDRDMVVVPARHADVRGLAGRRVAALRADQQRRLDQPTILERNARVPAIAHHFARFGRGHQLHIGRGLGRVAQGGAQQPVLEHDAERAFMLPGLEHQPSWPQSVAHLDGVDRTAFRLNPLADADRLEHPPGRTGDGGGASVEARRDRCLGIHRVDDNAGKAVPVEGHGQRQADHAAAEDNDVRPVHWFSSIFLPLGLKSGSDNGRDCQVRCTG